MGVYKTVLLYLHIQENTGQTFGPSGLDLNVEPVWMQGITGDGVVVGIVDDGINNFFGIGSVKLHITHIIPSVPGLPAATCTLKLYSIKLFSLIFCMPLKCTQVRKA